ncbi:MAG: oligosaccharide flippase family protein [Pararhodobacter sp.]|nr:oligosaccharide flippase family protein [Pararhodobacter sp.]
MPHSPARTAGQSIRLHQGSRVTSIATDNGPPENARQNSGLGARIMRGSALTIGGFALSNLLRLGSNLLLARLLFPEAFGLMALVTVLLIGLAMFSDIGLTPAIQSSKRGDDPAFLNTAWTVQVARGVLLCLAAAALAWPMARFYDEPMLLELILVSALSPLFLGFGSIKIEHALRHMMMARLTLMELVSQASGIAVMIALALATGSVWALVVGNLATSLTRSVVSSLLLTGPKSRFGFDRSAAVALLGYGKWIFLSTIASFAMLQSDKLVLGHFLSMGELGVYNIAFFLASFPLLLGHALNGRLMIPIYRESPPGTSKANDQRLRRVRLMLTGLLFVLSVPLALGGIWLIELLYDPRYAAAGALLVLLGLAQMPQMIGLTYDQAALAAGDSRGYFLIVATRACLIVTVLILAVPVWGAAGAALALALSSVLAYPLQVRLAIRHRAWHAAHDGLAIVFILLVAGLVLALHGDALLP